jgi:hypothetical protein
MFQGAGNAKKAKKAKICYLFTKIRLIFSYYSD